MLLVRNNQVENAMTIAWIVAPVGVCGFCYLILSFQVSNSFPPFYAKGDTDDEFMFMLPCMLAIAATMFATFFVLYLFALFGLVSAWRDTCKAHCPGTNKRPSSLAINPTDHRSYESLADVSFLTSGL